VIHPTAQIDPLAQLGPEVEVGAFAIIEGGVDIAAGCKIAAHAIIKRGSTLGEKVCIDHHAVIGGDPQDLSFNPQTESGLKIGARTVVREHATLHRATKAGQFTEIGHDCFIMASAHVAHDCIIGHHVILANGSMIGGHVQVQDFAFVSGGTAVHQFCRVGEGSLISGNAAITGDVPPYTLAHSRDLVAGLNLIGLRRRNVAQASIIEIKKAYHQVLDNTNDCKKQAETLLATAEYQTVEGLKFLRFFLDSKRGRFACPS
jgi:UDP-N-acetylglucosamine acyltransferase